MLQDGKITNTVGPTDFEGLIAQFSALREDTAALASSVAKIADRKGHEMAADISNGINEAAHYVERKAHNAEVQVGKSVNAHPLWTLGLAAATGLVIGAMVRR